jgi:hypothetical protein
VKALLVQDPTAHAALVQRLRLENEPLGRNGKPH